MSTLKQHWFLSEVPGKPMGRYAHIITIRVTDSYPLFQTDGELNTARVSAGTQHKELLPRITIFKRKQSTPERLVGASCCAATGSSAASRQTTRSGRLTPTGCRSATITCSFAPSARIASPMASPSATAAPRSRR